MSNADPHSLIAAAQQTLEIVPNRLGSVGVALNLKPGKSAVALQLRGKNTAKLLRQLLIEQNGWFEFAGANLDTAKIQITEQYQHLGSCAVGSGTLRPEIRFRLELAASPFPYLCK